MSPDDGAARGCVAVIASCMMDMITTVTRMPRLGETLRGRSFQLGFGGKGANQAVMAARAGADVRLVARVGDDAFGRMTIENFAARGIGTGRVLVTPHTSTGAAPILVRDDGANLVLIVPGANDQLCAEDVLQSAADLRGAAVVVGQLEVPQVATLTAFELTRQEGGATTILNPAPADAIGAALLRATDILVANEVELGQLAQVPCESPEQAWVAARAVMASGPGTVVVTLGARGALLAQAARALHFAPYPAQAVDTTGAGDAFVGALAAELAGGKALEPAVAFANVAAGLSTESSGTQVSFPDAATARALLDAEPPSVRTLA